MPYQLIVLPDHTAMPFLKAVDGAKKSIRVKMFLFSHPGLIDAVIRAKKRGVDVRVMLNPARRSGKSENAGTAKKLKAAKIEVSDSNPAFDVTHEKSMVVDDRIAFVSRSTGISRISRELETMRWSRMTGRKSRK